MLWKEDDLIDVAIGKIATQSSICKMSRENDACRAVNPCIYNQKIPYSSCTACEFNPWWMIDLESEYKIEAIFIYNSSIDPEAIKTLEIYVSNDKEYWQYIEKDLFVWNRLTSIEINLSQRISARYVKFSLQGKNSLKLKKVQIFIRKHKGVIIPTRQDGFGARMIAVLNAMYLAEKTGFKFRLWWPEYKNYGDKDNAIIVENENKIFSEKFIQKYSITNSKIDIIEGLEYASIDDIKNGNFGSTLGWWKSYPLDRNTIIDLDESDYIETCKKNWRNIDFSTQYKNIILSQSQYLNKNRNNIGIHVRNGETIFAYNFRRLIFQKMIMDRFFPLELVIELVLRNQSGESNIILFGMDTEGLNKVKCITKSLSESKLVFLSSDFISKEMSEMEKIFFDVSLLSQVRSVFCVKQSFYTKFASLIGDCRLVEYDSVFSMEEQFDIIVKNIEKYNFGKLNRAASYAYLYTLAVKLNKTFEVKEEILNKAFENDNINYAYKIMLIDNLLELQKIERVEKILSDVLCENYHLFIETIFCKIPSECLNWTKRLPLGYIDLINKIVECANINTPMLNYIAAKYYQIEGDYEKAKKFCEMSLERDQNNSMFLELIHELKKEIKDEK
ncbi:hypothetical protein A0X34_00605 [Campylobacter coli]|uniref:discoidin domain-containing protein n=1 Tax=Campylobacter TaxID=194 RepID=UPI0012CD77FC|nr:MULTISPECIES: discoidin domain-containing protein [Campylobacter]EAJ2879208.1 hypothetical protein [Campylobacter coli]EAJ7402777.1 hypothetical protein [Campylobacter coli]EAL0599751.1 hypothetical protein [Campylobacter coli]ECQ1773410.1 hypothetical protein [Campylobacter coli]EDP5051364.1 hypothetical protein [Campylobacter jejuni]